MLAENKPSTFVNSIEYTKPAQEKLVLQYRKKLNKFFLTGRIKNNDRNQNEHKN